jgi:ABC-2 type transport system permease protein
VPAGVRWFAEHQPFTQVADSARALLAGDPAGSSVLGALAWSAGIALVGYWRALVLFRRGSRVTR